jgi:hypothetical protein
VREQIFKEPGGGRRAWLLVLIGCYFLVEAVFFREGLSDRLVYLAFGIAVLGFGVADLLPRDRRRIAGSLRIGGGTLIVLALTIRAIHLVALAT